VALSCIALSKGRLTVGIAPEWGGALTRFDLKVGNTQFDILRRATEPKSGAPRALGASSFPMIPYAGRLREGRFEFEGRSIDYPLNALPERHSSHGDGFTRPWGLTTLERHHAVLELLPAAFAPIQYHCTQSIELADDRLDVRFSIRNLESRRIPIGIGLHPYFAHRQSAKLRAHLPVQWHWDTELMPTYAAPNARAAEFESGVAAADLQIAAQYCGWDGQAQIEWPAERVQVKLLTRPALAHVVVWAPTGEDFFCFEPINHATDSFNLCQREPSDIDMQPTVLEAGDTFEQSFAFVVSHGEDLTMRRNDAF
jgi:aldose 1-epimerase